MDLNALYTLPRAGRYTNPLNSNARLPLVYGDLTDGSSGNWVLPCIDTVNFVYCFAASAVLSVGNGNSINIYADGSLVDPANYTFDESDDFESEGTIAKVTFTSDQGNAEITARGKGKDDGAGTLMESIIDIVNDFLTVENDLTAGDFESTSKAGANTTFTAQSYAAAGVIPQDVKAWDLLQSMMGSFLGSIYRNAQRKIVLEIDDNTPKYNAADIMPRGHVVGASAVQRLDNLINRCPCNYAYNYVSDEFSSHTDTAAAADDASIGMYGTQEPKAPMQFYWCRDLTSVQTVQALVVTKFKDPVWELRFSDDSFGRIGMDAGDILAVPVSFLYDLSGNAYTNQLFKLISVRTEFAEGREGIQFRAIDSGMYRYGPGIADGTWTAGGSIKAGDVHDTTVY